jgi:hypothetical protein
MFVPQPCDLRRFSLVFGSRRLAPHPVVEARIAPNQSATTKDAMRIAVAIILFLLWWLGIFGTYAIGSSADLLLVIALLLLVVELRFGDV